MALIRNGNGRSRDRLFSRSLHLPEMTPTGARRWRGKMQVLVEMIAPAL
ncbi:hypothetical protein [Bradyrhizobium erythrophlei]|nr:hypothetical protein [Bradyrhizobium erythrophlei]